MHNPQLRYRLHRINVPTLLLWGASDGVVPVAYAEAYRQMIPGATLVVIPEAGHLPHIEQPNVLLQHGTAALEVPAISGPARGLRNMPSAAFEPGQINLRVTMLVKLMIGDHDPLLRIERKGDIGVDRAPMDRDGIDDFRIGETDRKGQRLTR